MEALVEGGHACAAEEAVMRKGDGGWGMGAGLAQQCSRLIRDVCGRRVAGPVHDDEPKDEPVLRLNPLRTRLTFTSGGRGV